jgi:hypothetical protein
MPSQSIPVYPQGSLYWLALYKWVRYDFFNSGVNTWAKAPAQHPDSFEKLDNCFSGMDVVRRRWGYASLFTPTYAVQRLFMYQNNLTNARRILTLGTNKISAYNEDGTTYTTQIAPQTMHTPQAVLSRNYEYISTGTSQDLKWDGTLNWVPLSGPVGNTNVGGTIVGWSLTGSGVSAPSVTLNAVANPVSSVVNASQISFPLTGGGQYAEVSQQVRDGGTSGGTSSLFAVAGAAVTYSIYLKAQAGTPTVQVLLYDATGPTTIGTANFALNTSTWTRATVTATLGSYTTPQIRVAVRNPASSAAAVIYAYGAQLEYGSTANTYQDTGSSQYPAPLSNWGITAPPTAPVATPGLYLDSSSWQASTFYSNDGAVIIDSNGNLQQVTVGGLSGGVAPAWAVVVGNTTTDNQVTWTCLQLAASLTWAAHTAYTPGSFIKANSCLFQLQPLTAISTNSVVNWKYYPMVTGANGAFAYSNASSGLPHPLPAATASGTITSLMLNYGGDTTATMVAATLNGAGEVTGTTTPYGGQPQTSYSLILYGSISVPVAGNYSFTASYDDGMFFGMDGGATLVSGVYENIDEWGFTVTPFNGYPILGGNNNSGAHANLTGNFGGINVQTNTPDQFVINFPSSGTYNYEFCYTNWQTRQIFSIVQQSTYDSAPLNIYPATDISAATAPSWPSWTDTLAPKYPSVHDGAAYYWSNLGPSTDFAWTASTNYLSTNGYAVDESGNQENPYRSGVSGTAPPTFASGLNELTTDHTGGTLEWINVGKAQGNLTLLSGRVYFVAYKNSTTGNYSALSPASTNTGPITNSSVLVQWSPATSSDPQAPETVLLATLDGGDETTLYEIATVSTGSYVDNVADTTLAFNNVYAEVDAQGLQHGLLFNSPPPVNTTQGNIVIKHKGRLAMISGTQIAFSKSLDEVTTSTGVIAGNYEEDWPATWVIDVSEGATTPRALLSDGVVLYVGTERNIQSIQGDNILNFSLPQLVFNDVGVLNHSVWQRVFKEGQPVGTMWLTPDFRVMQSDFNSYTDVGAPIQDQLNGLNVAQAQSIACAMAASDGEHDLYMLAVPTGSSTVNDTLFVYNLRSGTWSVWQLADSISAMLYNINSSGAIQRLFAIPGSPFTVNVFDASYTSDRATGTPVSITSTVRTAWVPFADPRFRKMLNDIEVITAETGTMLVTIEGASTPADFASPFTVISNASLSQGVLGQGWKVFLAGTTTKYKYYRFTFATTGTNLQVLNGFNVEYVQMQI